uniref:Uncharacterized protein n=1 Tax=Anguilla anguilla TaxID=7936 RepID=A0A0E9QK97_ANGAN
MNISDFVRSQSRADQSC